MQSFDADDDMHYDADTPRDHEYLQDLASHRMTRAGEGPKMAGAQSHELTKQTSQVLQERDEYREMITSSYDSQQYLPHPTTFHLPGAVALTYLQASRPPSKDHSSLLASNEHDNRKLLSNWTSLIVCMMSVW